jgi:hypothetical protein
MSRHAYILPRKFLLFLTRRKVRQGEKIWRYNSALIQNKDYTVSCHKLLGIYLPLYYCRKNPTKAWAGRENWLTLANVCLGESSDGAFNRDLLQVVMFHHLQAPYARIFRHDVHNLMVIGVSVCHFQVLFCDAWNRPWRRMGERMSLPTVSFKLDGKWL